MKEYDNLFLSINKLYFFNLIDIYTYLDLCAKLKRQKREIIKEVKSLKIAQNVSNKKNLK